LGKIKNACSNYNAAMPAIICMDRLSKLTKLANYVLTTLKRIPQKQLSNDHATPRDTESVLREVDTFISSTSVAVMPSTDTMAVQPCQNDKPTAASIF
jgi:hypothetical protein